MVLVNQFITGIFLTISYKPDANLTFASIEDIYARCELWLVDPLYAFNGSIYVFIVIYLHMFRGVMYGSYQEPRELLWLVGMALFVIMVLAFTGYMLPWGQVSYWESRVIVSMLGAVPLIGDTLSSLILGDFLLSDAVLSRFFAYHVVTLPVLLVKLVFVHILALHEVGSNNPDDIEIKVNRNPKANIPVDGIPL